MKELTSKALLKRNILLALIANATLMLANFFTQRVFVDSLGVEFLGLNSLFSSITSVLLMADFGLGAAIVFHLYKALHEKSAEQVASLLKFYQKACRIVSLIILGLGLILAIFIPRIADQMLPTGQLLLYWALFIFNAALSYSLVFRRSLLQADRHNYIISAVHTGYAVVICIAQITVLLTTHDYVWFLVAMVGSRLAENLALDYLARHRYAAMLAATPVALPAPVKKDIRQRMRASVFHNSAAYVVLGSDNLLISLLFGVSAVGYYANYYVIINALQTLTSQAFSSIAAHIGHFSLKYPERLLDATRRLIDLNTVVAIFVACGFYFLSRPFITIWLGGDFVLANSIVLALTFNLYLMCARFAPMTVMTANGVVYQNRFVPIAEAVINIVASLAFAACFGLVGIFIGTICSNLFLHLYSFPKYLFELVLHRPRREYLRIFAWRLTIAVAVWLVLYHLVGLFNRLS
ncbi:MAG: hypothetical protein LBM12_01395 [Candidatus Nomurabacteria bacterium]|jgi:O-antigen/teichoic acid export membrane protein|nr:hypothetical protein [Candidatus Nomurabacteria bacterium]